MTGPLSTIRIMAPLAYTVRRASAVRPSLATHRDSASSLDTALKGPQ